MGKKNMKRIQRKRTKGWQSPPYTRFCGRPSKYGNPFKVIEKGPACFIIENTLSKEQGIVIHKTKEAATKVAFQMYAYFLHQKYPTGRGLKDHLRPLLRYDNLSCWCKEDEECHVDYLIKLINRLWDE